MILIFVGAVLVLSQLFTFCPYQPAIALGVLLALAGACRMVDGGSPERTGRRVRGAAGQARGNGHGAGS